MDRLSASTLTTSIGRAEVAMMATSFEVTASASSVSRSSGGTGSGALASRRCCAACSSLISVFASSSAC